MKCMVCKKAEVERWAEPAVKTDPWLCDRCQRAHKFNPYQSDVRPKKEGFEKGVWLDAAMGAMRRAAEAIGVIEEKAA